MKEQKPRIGKKGGAKRIAEELSKIRRAPLSNKISEIVEESNRTQKPDKKSAKPQVDLDV